MDKLYLIIFCLIIGYFIFKEQKIETMIDAELNNIFDVNNGKYYAKKSYPPNDIILRCTNEQTNICSALNYSNNDGTNTKILNMADDKYPLISSRGIKKGDEIIVKSLSI